MQTDRAKLFSSEAVQHELTMAGLYMVAFELVKSSILDQPKSFFLGAAFASEQHAGARVKYRTEVLARDVDPLIASALWHVEMGALSEDDVDLIRALRRHRNELAHELPAFIVDEVRTVRVDLIPKLLALVRQVDTWWILNVHVPTNPDYDGVEVDPVDVSSGPTLLLQYLVDMLSTQSGSAQ